MDNKVRINLKCLEENAKKNFLISLSKQEYEGSEVFVICIKDVTDQFKSTRNEIRDKYR